MMSKSLHRDHRIVRDHDDGDLLVEVRVVPPRRRVHQRRLGGRHDWGGAWGGHGGVWRWKERKGMCGRVGVWACMRMRWCGGSSCEVGAMRCRLMPTALTRGGGGGISY